MKNDYINYVNKVLGSRKKILFLGLTKMIIGSLSTLLIIYLNKVIINAYLDGKPDYFTMLMLLLISGEVILRIIVLHLTLKERQLIMDKERKLNLTLLEQYLNVDNTILNEEYAIKFSKAKNFLASHGFANAYGNYSNIIQNILTCFGSVFLLDKYLLLVIFIICIFTLINVLIKKKLDIKIFTERQKLNPFMRSLFYMLGVMWDNQYAKEIRMFSLRPWFHTETEKIVKDAQNIGIGYFKKMSLLDFINNFIYIIQLCLIYGILIILTVKGKIAIAQFTLYVTVVTTFTLAIKGIIFAVSELVNNRLYFKNYQDFIDASKSDKEYKKIDVIEKIEFKNVYFKYENSKETIIVDLSFKLKKGESLVIVGKNGMGKTTIIRLLLRFIKPIAGHIYINDIDLADIDIASYYENLSCLFQNDFILPYSIAENITPNDIDVERANKALAETLFYDSLKEYKVDLNDSLTNKLDKNGVNFSGGENQQLLLTRVLYKNSDFLVFDEPASNLSRQVELKFYANLNKLRLNKLVLMVSHRLDFCETSDKILLLDKKGYTEYGSHHDLLTLNKVYALMYNKYRNRNYE